ncbi:hypothetical protein KSP40_PGU021694 [Platanthera guangdongensis]|uniref:Uncharacterized protein n=1 Tax=Platanthera guangdongensis TaxID=2320717 RepID=A0ABR2MVN9_9ASPA
MRRRVYFVCLCQPEVVYIRHFASRFWRARQRRSKLGLGFVCVSLAARRFLHLLLSLVLGKLMEVVVSFFRCIRYLFWQSVYESLDSCPLFWPAVLGWGFTFKLELLLAAFGTAISAALGVVNNN